MRYHRGQRSRAKEKAGRVLCLPVDGASRQQANAEGDVSIEGAIDRAVSHRKAERRRDPDDIGPRPKLGDVEVLFVSGQGITAPEGSSF